jgi:hypothetical protein
MTEAQQFDDWLKSNYLFDTSNFIKDEDDREKAKSSNPTWMAWKHQQQRIDELENKLELCQALMQSDDKEVIALQGKLKIAVDALKKIDDGRDTHKIEKCTHGKYGYEDCEGCLTDVATKALKQIEVK